MNCGNCSGLYSIYHEHRVVFENDACSQVNENMDSVPLNDSERVEFEFKKTAFGKYRGKKVKNETEYIGIEDKSGK